ncbi:hypothetical protein WMY93_006933 [Mugilogobius chulae]|uniref:Broad substrate specificity ATP-binding cassette transporter ABCG2 n=1 Tax=Mugilogobius chulae TaxID=88201 RepID=A0AAW0PSK4_9GOBI
MEQANHINIAMVENIGTNGSRCTSEVQTNAEQDLKPLGSTVSFHSLQYNIQVKSGPLCKRKTTTRHVLLDLNGVMKPGLNAILGPTGSGKSSFLDILAARKDPAGLSGEEDVVMGTLTVKENLSFSAALRLPSSVSQSEKETRVNHLIKELGLTKVADSMVGSPMTRGISGGERKRTNIGMELIIDPSVLFLDEPTTGLDASTANSVLLLLKRMASHGRTIIMSIHQPRYSIYKLFDSLTLLVSGKMAYHGPAPNALDYFASIGYSCEPHNNPADFFLDVINGNSTARAMIKLQGSGDVDFEELSGSRQSIEECLVEEYRNSCYFSNTQTALGTEEDCAKPLVKPSNICGTADCEHFSCPNCGSHFYSVKDDQSGIQNRMGALFFITTNQCFSTVSAAELFIIERKLFVHEYISGYYRVSVYFLSKILADTVMRTLTSVIFSSIVYFTIGLKCTVEAFLIFTLTVTLVAYTATAMTLAIAADQSVVALANILMTITFVFMMIFSGLLVNLPSIVDWLSWLKYFSIPRYGLAALKVNEFLGLKFCEDTNESMATTARMNCSVSTTGLMCTGEQYLDYLGIEYTAWGLWKNHVALIIMMILFLIITYLKLRYMKKLT